MHSPQELKKEPNHDFVPRLTEYGVLELHSCPCGGTTMVCDICGGDYHEDLEEKKNCFLKK